LSIKKILSEKYFSDSIFFFYPFPLPQIQERYKNNTETPNNPQSRNNKPPAKKQKNHLQKAQNCHFVINSCHFVSY